MNNRKIVRSNWKNGINYENEQEFDGFGDYFTDDILLQVRNHSDDDEYIEEGRLMCRICGTLAA